MITTYTKPNINIDISAELVAEYDAGYADGLLAGSVPPPEPVPPPPEPTPPPTVGSYTVTGTGFGTRTAIVQERFDDCSGVSPADLWSGAYVNNFAYIPPQRGVALPHTNISKYAAAQASAGIWSNGWLALNASVVLPSKFFCMAYYRKDPAWDFGPNTTVNNDNNEKMLMWSGGSGVWERPYWYHNRTNQKPSLEGSWQNSFYSSGALGALNKSYVGEQGGVTNQTDDPWYNWVKQEYRIGIGSSGQEVKYLCNNKSYFNEANQNTYNAAGTGFCAAIGNYSRARTENNWTYLADTVMVVGDDAYARVILTDSPAYNTSNITEYQHINAWSDTSIDITVNKGKLTGTAYIHVFDKNDVSQYVGTVEV